jgi:hypothetical protein
VGLDSLATGAGDVRERILTAYSSFHPLKESDFPEHLREDYKWVMAQLTKYGPVYDHNGNVRVGSVENTLRHIKNSTGVKIANKLLFLYHELNSYVYPR